LLQRLLLRQDCNFPEKRTAVFLQDGSHWIKASGNHIGFPEAFLKENFASGGREEMR